MVSPFLTLIPRFGQCKEKKRRREREGERMRTLGSAGEKGEEREERGGGKERGMTSGEREKRREGEKSDRCVM